MAAHGGQVVADDVGADPGAIHTIGRSRWVSPDDRHTARWIRARLGDSAGSQSVSD
ncbi:MAG: hypothetical protein ACHQX3_09130 [Nitrospirales bacterium]